MQNLVGVRVADAAEEPRVGERTLDRVILQAKARGEILECRVEGLESSAAELGESVATANEMQRGAAFRSGFGEREYAGRKLERGEVVATAGFGTFRLPVQSTGDHQMDDDEQLAVRLDRDAFAESLDGDDALADQVGEWWLDGAEQERRLETDLFERLADDPAPERLDVDGDVRQLRHCGAP